MLKAVVIMFSSCYDAHSAESANFLVPSMCLSLHKLSLSLHGQVYPKMLMFISVGLIRISIGLSKLHQYKSATEMFIFCPKPLIYPRKTIN